MNSDQGNYEALIIGGGFYGAVIANHLVEELGFKRVILVEKEHHLMLRASANNQARVHLGTHYPRDLKTAMSSRSNQPQFLEKFNTSIYSEFTHLYALARLSSKVSSTQFRKFCENAEIELKNASDSQRALFNSDTIEEVFVVKEPVFNAEELSRLVAGQMKKNGVEVMLGLSAKRLRKDNSDCVVVSCVDKSENLIEITSKFVFNCTYSEIDTLEGDLAGIQTKLKYELAEVALFVPPKELEDFGITVMDGNFFSFIPFPSKQLHSLTHVKYTPRLTWNDELPRIKKYNSNKSYPDINSSYDLMIRDSQKYVPNLTASIYVESFYETKVLLVVNENDDGRPILFEEDTKLRNFYYVLGSKLDNVFDVLKKISAVVRQSV
jgi:glycine/D-amino acid oxidase-like deaminating enzyme